ncbi:MAG: ABC transporter ATP-binding protein [Actinomycetia bacterium]|nr:ABC transporter ATP-binding protein [Actinomycetes bacterium]MCP4224460.1 ABC transporter ATP-binding protein [Actinomycetes bacterium]MCP5032225.1 ABC transporter ATP-binding protein [Actinomycetes bacterium]
MGRAIETEQLTKYYGQHRGILDVDLRVEEGEVFGFLGPNGSGKSTTIRLLLDLLRPTDGTVRVLGLDPRTSSVELRHRIGYLPGDLALYDNMTGRQLTQFFASLRSVDVTDSVARLARRFDFDLDRPIGDLSTGNRQKAGLIQAFMHDPDLLILDEPTSGLDPLMQQEFYALIDETRTRGRTVFLSSHVLPEVEHIADRVAIIREGQIVVVEELAVLKQQAIRRLDIAFAEPIILADFADLKSVVSADVSANRLRLSLRITGAIDEVVKAAAHYEVLNLSSQDGDLEEVFLDYYGRQPDASEGRSRS